jgi:homoserine dehydrogenase
VWGTIISAETAAVLARAVGSGNGAVTANKKPVSGDITTFKALTADGRRFRCESTCCPACGFDFFLRTPFQIPDEF